MELVHVCEHCYSENDMLAKVCRACTREFNGYPKFVRTPEDDLPLEERGITDQDPFFYARMLPAAVIVGIIAVALIYIGEWLEKHGF